MVEKSWVATCISCMKHSQPHLSCFVPVSQPEYDIWQAFVAWSFTTAGQLDAITWVNLVTLDTLMHPDLGHSPFFFCVHRFRYNSSSVKYELLLFPRIKYFPEHYVFPEREMVDTFLISSRGVPTRNWHVAFCLGDVHVLVLFVSMFFFMFLLFFHELFLTQTWTGPFWNPSFVRA